jgi:hypothetical protein
LGQDCTRDGSSREHTHQETVLHAVMLGTRPNIHKEIHCQSCGLHKRAHFQRDSRELLT